MEIRLKVAHYLQAALIKSGGGKLGSTGNVFDMQNVSKTFWLPKDWRCAYVGSGLAVTRH